MKMLPLSSSLPFIILALSSGWCRVEGHRHNKHHHHRHHNHPGIANGTVGSCGTPDYSPELINRIMQVSKRKKSIFQTRSAAPPPSNITIDTYFCVVIDTLSNAEWGDVANEALYQQISVLNSNFANSGSLFRFEMRGVQRYTYEDGYYKSLDTYIAELGLACRQGGLDALNIFVVPRIIAERGGETVGISWPFFFTGLNYIDGVYIHHQAMPGQGFPYTDLGLIAVHEVGHWLGLIHPFQAVAPFTYDPCNANNPNDYIADTPQMASATFGCPVGRDSCPNRPGLDPTNNYMDYTNDYDNTGRQCKTAFTPQQVARMQNIWDYYRVQNDICTSSELQVGIEILFDQKPNETSWDVTFANGTMVHSSIPDLFGGTYSPAFAGQSINVTFCLSINTYIFHIFDSKSNGLDNPGYYQLSVNGQVVSNGGSNIFSVIGVPFGSPAPTPAPTLAPAPPPTLAPTPPPTLAPTPPPTLLPTLPLPTSQPTLPPTPPPRPVQPTRKPRNLKPPTLWPTTAPSILKPSTPSPSALSTPSPSSMPVILPTAFPTLFPTTSPTSLPPSASPTSPPSLTATQSPTTFNQSSSAPPAAVPTNPPVVQTNPPTSTPSKNANFTFGSTTNKTTTVIVTIPPGMCFSELNTVQVENKGIISMKQLQVGDLVQDATGAMAHVYSFGHYHKTAKTEYLQIHVQSLARPLEISKDHLLFVNGRAVPASLLAVGDKVDLGLGRGVATVVKINSVIRSGAYAPFTSSGTIMVSGVAASSYVSLQEGSSTLVLGAYKTPLSMHWLAHIFQSPHRLACLWRSAYCKSESYTVDGISKWVEGPLHVSKWLVRQNGLVMACLFLPAFSCMLLLYWVELAYIHMCWTVAGIGFVVSVVQFWRSRSIKR